MFMYVTVGGGGVSCSIKVLFTSSRSWCRRGVWVPLLPPDSDCHRGIRNVVMLMESIWFPSLLPPLTPRLLPHSVSRVSVSPSRTGPDLTGPVLSSRRGCVASATCPRPAGRCPPCSPRGCCPKPSAGCSASTGWRSPGSWTPPRSRKISTFREAARRTGPPNLALLRLNEHFMLNNSWYKNEAAVAATRTDAL